MPKYLLLNFYSFSYAKIFTLKLFNSSLLNLEPAVNRQPSYRQGTRRAELHHSMYSSIVWLAEKD